MGFTCLPAIANYGRASAALTMPGKESQSQTLYRTYGKADEI